MPAQGIPVIRVLLIEDNHEYARLIKEMLRESKHVDFDMAHEDCLSKGLSFLNERKTDIILLDLSLPDSSWPNTLLDVLAKAPDVPIVCLTGFDDAERSVEAVHKGAQDYLVKDHVDANLLARTIRYAIERHNLKMELREMSLSDDLTGIYNRRGFLTLAQQQVKMANRMKVRLLLLFADLDGMKWINDNLGHHEGDRALIETAGVLKETFRESDIIARIGGDEFAVIAMEESETNDGILVERLQENLDAHNASKDRAYKLSISAGIVHYDPESPCSIDELLDKADKLMYEQKRVKKKERI